MRNLLSILLPPLLFAQSDSPPETKHIAIPPAQAQEAITKRLAFPSNLKGEINTLSSKSATTQTPVQMLYFQDVQCGMCNRWFLRAFPTIKDRYINSGKVQFIFM